VFWLIGSYAEAIKLRSIERYKAFNELYPMAMFNLLVDDFFPGCKYIVAIGCAIFPMTYVVLIVYVADRLYSFIYNIVMVACVEPFMNKVWNKILGEIPCKKVEL